MLNCTTMHSFAPRFRLNVIAFLKRSYTVCMENEPAEVQQILECLSIEPLNVDCPKNVRVNLPDDVRLRLKSQSLVGPILSKLPPERVEALQNQHNQWRAHQERALRAIGQVAWRRK